MQDSDAALLREECTARQVQQVSTWTIWDEAGVGARFSFSRTAALIVSEQGGQLDAHRLAHALARGKRPDGRPDLR